MSLGPIWGPKPRRDGRDESDDAEFEAASRKAMAQAIREVQDAITREAALAAAGTARNRQSGWLATPAQRAILRRLNDELTAATDARLVELAGTQLGEATD